MPPAPADVVITLAAFLSHRGATEARTVLLVTLAGNFTGALIVYGLARHLGRRFVTSRLGRGLLSPEAVVAVERGYLRWGLPGLFIARLLPGFRSFTAPFAGLVGLSVPRMLLPIALASTLWYTALVTIGARLGENWETVTRVLSGLNRSLAVLAALAAVGLLGWWLRRRRRRGRARLRDALEERLAAYPAIEERALVDPGAAAVAALLLEVTRADRALTPDELEAVERHLRARWHLGAPDLPDPDGANAARAVVEQMAPAARLGVARRLWELAFSDGGFARHESRVMARAAELLGLSPEELEAARRRSGE